jgi:hypothetical protein
MISLHQKILLLFLVLILAGCGGNSSAINNPTISLVTPVSSVIAAGSTLQLQAIVSGSSNTTVLWFVNNIPGGNSNVGTISPQGLYTAPNIPTTNGSVLISASPQAYPVAITSILIGITFSSVSFSGNYVFSIQGTQSGNPWAATGSFTANGNGTISNGYEDINSPAGPSPPALPFSGSYIVNANGQGMATFTSAQGSYTVSFTLNAQGQLSVMRTDSGGVASGQFYPQVSNALTLTSLDAPFVFRFIGSDASSNTLNSIGFFLTDGTTTLSYAEEDLNDGGTTANQPFSGTYSIGNNARGTASFTDSTGTRTYAFYIVSPTQLQFIEIDNLGYLSGIAYQQQSVNLTTVLTGNYVFFAAGNAGTSAYGTAGGFFSNSATISGNINAGTSDINQAGTQSTNATLIGSFTTLAYGRGTISLTGASGTTNYVYYSISPLAAFIITSDTGINASGDMFAQTGGYSTASLFGYFSLALSSPVNITAPSAAVGLLDLNGTGAMAGFVNTNINGTSSGQLSITGTDTVTTGSSGTSTRGVATITRSDGTSSDYVFYPISSGAVIIMGVTGLPTVGTLISQY